MDDNDSTLAELQIDRQLKALRQEVQQLGHSRTGGENNKSARRIAEGIIILALAAFGAAIWTLRESVAVLQNSQNTQTASITLLAAQVSKNSEDIAEMKGRVYRGLQRGEDLLAPNK